MRVAENHFGASVRMPLRILSAVMPITDVMHVNSTEENEDFAGRELVTDTGREPIKVAFEPFRVSQAVLGQLGQPLWSLPLDFPKALVEVCPPVSKGRGL